MSDQWTERYNKVWPDWGHIMKNFGCHGKKSRLKRESGKEPKEYL